MSADLWDRSKGADALAAAAAGPEHDPGLLPPPSAAQAEEAARSASYDLARRLAAEFPDALPFHRCINEPYISFTFKLGFQVAITALAERPDLVHRMLQRLQPQASAHLLAQRHLGMSLLHVQTCYCSADIISPTMFQEFVTPYTGSALAFYEGLGFRTVYYFAGNPMPLLPYLKELPFTALSIEEDRKAYGTDLREVRRALGPDRVLFGNLDASFVEQASDEDLLREVRHQIDMAGSQNFILSVGSPLTPATSLDRVRLLTESTRLLRGR